MRLRDRDSAERLYLLKAVVWSIPGAVIGLLAGAFVGARVGVHPAVAAVLGATIGAGTSYGTVRLLARAAGAAAQTVYAPSGTSTPVKRDYSFAQSLIARGRYEEAVAAYENHALEFPEDPEPPLQLARLTAQHLQRHEESARWLRHARHHCPLTSGQQLMVAQELVRIYIDVLQEPRRAMPELSRIVAGFPGTSAAQSAQRELEVMRELLAREHEGLVDFTAAYIERRRQTSHSPPNG